MGERNKEGREHVLISYERAGDEKRAKIERENENDGTVGQQNVF